MIWPTHEVRKQVNTVASDQISLSLSLRVCLPTAARRLWGVHSPSDQYGEGKEGRLTVPDGLGLAEVALEGVVPLNSIRA